MRIAILCCSIVGLYAPSLMASDPPQPVSAKQCIKEGGPPAPGRRERILPAADREMVDVLNDRAQALAAAFIKIEDALRVVGHEPNDFPAKSLSWAAVIDGDELIAAVYARSEAGLVKVDMLGSGGMNTLAARLSLAEQALLHTPVDCGDSYGSLDIGLPRPSGAGRFIHSLRLVDRRQALAWGMHYRFEVDEGSLTHVDRLHTYCSEGITSIPSGYAKTTGLVPGNRPIYGGSMLSMPDRELPTEAQLMQFHLNPDLPGTTSFAMKTRYFSISQGRHELPIRYRTAINPCSVADPGEAKELK